MALTGMGRDRLETTLGDGPGSGMLGLVAVTGAEVDWRVVGSIASSQGLCLSLQNLLLYVQTVGVTMWFSWPCLGKSLIESRTRKTNHQIPPGSLALPVTLITTVTIPAGLMTPHLRHPYLMAVAAGASVRVSIGETRWRCTGGMGMRGKVSRSCGLPEPG